MIQLVFEHLVPAVCWKCIREQTVPTLPELMEKWWETDSRQRHGRHGKNCEDRKGRAQNEDTQGVCLGAVFFLLF